MFKNVLPLFLGAAAASDPRGAREGAAEAHAGVDLVSYMQLSISARGEEEAAPYYWPSARGRAPNISASTHAGPQNLSDTFAWEWHHPDGKYNTFTTGTVLDEKMNIYLGAYDGIRKFTPDGALLWTFATHSNIPTVPSLMGGKLFGNTVSGKVFALDMDNGQEVWSNVAAPSVGADTACVGSTDGIVVTATDHCQTHICQQNGYTGNRVVRGLNASDGTQLWQYKPEAAMWNFMPLFTGADSFAFQDSEGRLYHNALRTGKSIWKRGGMKGTWTSGSAMLSPYGVVYSVSVHGTHGADTQGSVRAYWLKDGTRLFWQRVYRPPNTFPAVGYVSPRYPLSLVQAVGQQCGPNKGDVYSFDAFTGKFQWLWQGPTHNHSWCAGDEEGKPTRKNPAVHARLGGRERCHATPWSAPTIGVDGTIYLGNHNGRFYAIRDRNGNKQIEDAEVSTYDIGSAFPSPGASIAPGLVAIASCDSLHVFREGARERRAALADASTTHPSQKWEKRKRKRRRWR